MNIYSYERKYINFVWMRMDDVYIVLGKFNVKAFLILKYFLNRSYLNIKRCYWRSKIFQIGKNVKNEKFWIVKKLLKKEFEFWKVFFNLIKQLNFVV